MRAFDGEVVRATVIRLATSGLSGAITSGSVEAIAYGDDARLQITLSSRDVAALPAYHEKRPRARRGGNRTVTGRGPTRS